MSQPPTMTPERRTEIPPADAYRPGELVWVWQRGTWLPGSVEAVGPYAVRVSYQVHDDATDTDTVTPHRVMPRELI